MSLEKISAHLQNQKAANVAKGVSDTVYPPVEKWDPPFCGNIDLQIKANGDWFYNGTIFKRLSLVKLFASVLKKEEENYYLVTPVEKVGITVEDAPYVLTQWHWQDSNQTSMQVSTHLGDTFMLNKAHALVIKNDNLYINVRRNLYAKVHRNVYYQWVELAKEEQINTTIELAFYSDGERFCLGVISE